jgi:hypothetical protein
MGEFQFLGKVAFCPQKLGILEKVAFCPPKGGILRGNIRETFGKHSGNIPGTFRNNGILPPKIRYFAYNGNLPPKWWYFRRRI